MIDHDWINWGNRSDVVGGGGCPEFFRLCELARLEKALVVGLKISRIFFSKKKQLARLRTGLGCKLSKMYTALSGESLYPSLQAAKVITHGCAKFVL